MKCRDTQHRIVECQNAEMNARSHGINPTVQVNLNKIGGLLFFLTD
jgi:hypothetical protein